MRPIFKIAILFLFASGVVGACKKDSNPQSANPVPYVTVNRQINTDNALYSKLNTPGGYVYLDDEGYKGVIVTRDYNDVFHAVDRACPYHPDAACAKATVERSGISIRCGSYNGTDFQPCCDSKYGLDGSLEAGPSQFPLRIYNVTQNGSLLIISN